MWLPGKGWPSMCLGALASFSVLQRDAGGGDNDADNGNRGSRELVVSTRLVLQVPFASCMHLCLKSLSHGKMKGKCTS